MIRPPARFTAGFQDNRQKAGNRRDFVVCSTEETTGATDDILVHLADYRPKSGRVFFDRQELRKILSLYSTRVARGEWRDYAIDIGESGVAFSVFRHSRDWPLYVIAKLAPGKHRPGGYVVLSGQKTLSRGRSIDDVLAALERVLEPA